MFPRLIPSNEVSFADTGLLCRNVVCKLFCKFENKEIIHGLIIGNKPIPLLNGHKFCVQGNFWFCFSNCLFTGNTGNFLRQKYIFWYQSYLVNIFQFSHEYSNWSIFYHNNLCQNLVKIGILKSSTEEIH